MSQILFPIIFFGIIGFVWWTFVGKKQSAMLAGQKDPEKRWAQGVYTLVSGDKDYGYEDKWDLRLGLSNAWSIENEQDFRKRYAEMTSDTSQESAAWNLVRAVNLSRMAAGADFITQEESWSQIATLKPRIQQQFASWEALGKAYVDGYTAWMQSSGAKPGPDEGAIQNASTAARDIWPTLNFKTI